MLFDRFINLGIDSQTEFYLRREAKIINLFSYLCLAGLFVGISTNFFISGDYAIGSVTFLTIASLLCLLLNYKHYYNLATYLFVISINLELFILCQQYIHTAGCYLYYFPVIFCIVSIHNPKLPRSRTIIFLFITLLSFILIWFVNIPSLRIANITKNDNAILLIYNSFLSFIITIVLVYIIVKLINKHTKESDELLQKEQEAQQKNTQALKEKEVLLAEIQHRVKNNLAIITGLLSLQSEKAPCDVSKQLMIESRNRVMSISMVHDRLYRKSDLSKIDLKLYISELSKELIKSFSKNSLPIHIQEDIEAIEFELTKAVPIGLIVNEAITNSLKHAFTDASISPTIYIKLKLVFDKIHLCISDNGKGFQDLENKLDTSLGLSLIESLADQIDATVSFRNENGACVSLVFHVN